MAPTMLQYVPTTAKATPPPNPTNTTPEPAPSVQPSEPHQSAPQDAVSGSDLRGFLRHLFFCDYSLYTAPSSGLTLADFHRDRKHYSHYLTTASNIRSLEARVQRHNRSQEHLDLSVHFEPAGPSPACVALERSLHRRVHCSAYEIGLPPHIALEAIKRYARSMDPLGRYHGSLSDSMEGDWDDFSHRVWVDQRYLIPAAFPPDSSNEELRLRHRLWDESEALKREHRILRLCNPPRTLEQARREARGLFQPVVGRPSKSDVLRERARRRWRRAKDCLAGKVKKFAGVLLDTPEPEHVPKRPRGIRISVYAYGAAIC